MMAWIRPRWHNGRANEGVRIRVVIPQNDGVVTESGLRWLQASSEDDHGPLCRDRRVFGSIEHLRR